jgi:hypothetical protein
LLLEHIVWVCRARFTCACRGVSGQSISIPCGGSGVGEGVSVHACGVFCRMTVAWRGGGGLHWFGKVCSWLRALMQCSSIA